MSFALGESSLVFVGHVILFHSVARIQNPFLISLCKLTELATNTNGRTIFKPFIFKLEHPLRYTAANESSFRNLFDFNNFINMTRPFSFSIHTKRRDFANVSEEKTSISLGK